MFYPTFQIYNPPSFSSFDPTRVSPLILQAKEFNNPLAQEREIKRFSKRDASR